MYSRRDYAIQALQAVKHDNGSYIDYNATQRWFNDIGELHREDGPAVIYTKSISLGSVYWYLNGTEYQSFDDWCIKLNKSDEAKMMLRLQYG
jgi:hypothetical protein